MAASVVHKFWYDHSMKCFIFPSLPDDTREALKAHEFVVREDVRGFLVTVVGDASVFFGVLHQSAHDFLDRDQKP